MKIITGFILLLFFSTNVQGQMNNEEMLYKVNAIRTKGCSCGGAYVMPVGAVVWNDTLEFSAYRYARHLRRFDLFGHFSIDGKDVGQRLDEYGYRWQFAGENLAEGQSTFDEVIRDWLKSESHCKMFMNANMKEMGIGYYKGIWVQHFGKKLEEGMKRKEGSVRKVN